MFVRSENVGILNYLFHLRVQMIILDWTVGFTEIIPIGPKGNQIYKPLKIYWKIYGVALIACEVKVLLSVNLW